MPFIRPSVSKTGFALSFADNLAIGGADQVAPFVAIQYANPHLNGLPIWGAGGGGISVVARIRVRNSIGYRSLLIWSRGDGGFLGSDGYWIWTAYPQSQTNSGTSWWWELAINAGDIIDWQGSGAGSGTPIPVTLNRPYDQGLTITRANANSKTLKSYVDLPNTGTNSYIQWTETSAGYGETAPTTPKLTMGDSPWYSIFQHERAGMDLDSIKIMTPAITESEMLAERSDMSRMVTPAGQSAIWWGKNGFSSIDDLTCSFGTGRTWAWADAANKGTLVARF